MYLTTFGRPYKRAWTANANTSSFAAKPPTVTEPTNDGVVVVCPPEGGEVPLFIRILPFGLGSNNDTFDMKVIGWERAGSPAPVGSAGAPPVWLPTTLGEFTCTISSTNVGVAGAYLLDTEMLADTIVAKSAPLIPKYPGFDATPAATFQSQVQIYSPADDTVGWIVLPLMGVQKFEVTFDQTSGTPTMNVLYRYF